MARIADEQNPLNKKAEAPRAHAGGMPEFVPTDEQRDCNRSPPFFQKLAPSLVGIEA